MTVEDIKKHLKKVLDSSTDLEKQNEIETKLQIFGGKLYKYYSFEDKWSIANFSGNIIHYSKPEVFNDPFDCGLCLPMDEAIGRLGSSYFMQKNYATNIASILNSYFKGCSFSIDGEQYVNFARLVQAVFNTSTFQKAMRGESDLSQDELERQIIEELINKDELGIDSDNHITQDNKMNDESIWAFSLLELFRFIMTAPENFNKIVPQDCLKDKNCDVVGLNELLSPKINRNKIRLFAAMFGADMKEIDLEFKKLDGEYKKTQKLTSAKINDLFAVSCFSESPSNVLMWSHYANKHTGFCVEYDFNTLIDKNGLDWLLPVVYSKDRIPLSLDQFDFSDPQNVKAIFNSDLIADIALLFLVKSDIWEYEKEWRIIREQKSLIDGHLECLPIISAVYLGANISPKDEQIIKDIALQKKIKLYKYAMDADTYSLKVAEIIV